jgi:WD40 repeat protein
VNLYLFINRNSCVNTFTGHSKSISDIQICNNIHNNQNNNNTNLFFTLSEDKTIRVWDKRESSAVKILNPSHPVSCLDWTGMIVININLFLLLNAK